MSVVAGLALAGVAFQTVGALAAAQEKKSLNRIHQREVEFQAKTEQDLFNFFTLPNLKQQQRARRGSQATQIAKGGVDVGSGSALAFLSEQARVDSLNQSLAIFQQNLKQRSFQVEQALTKRSSQQVSQEAALTAVGGGIEAGGIAAGAFL